MAHVQIVRYVPAREAYLERTGFVLSARYTFGLWTGGVAYRCVHRGQNKDSWSRTCGCTAE